MQRFSTPVLVVAAILLAAGAVRVTQAQNSSAIVQNAILEGIQFTSEPSSVPGEKIVTCYFIFQSKPSSFFYDKRHRQKKLVFEFNDTEIGSSPIPSLTEPPIVGFEIEKRKIDVNAEIRGLKPEWHDLVVVTFSLSAIPNLTVSEQYGVVSFSFPWSTDPSRIEQYIEKEKKAPIVPIAIASGAGIAAAGIIWALVPKPQPQADGPIPINDLPERRQWDGQK